MRAPGHSASMLLLTVTLCVLPWHSSQAGYTQNSGAKIIRVAPDLDVLEAQFGSFQYDEQRQDVVFTALRTLKMTPGTTYGWRLKLQTSRPEIDWIEHLDLPSPPTHWGISSQVIISLDRRSAVTRASGTPNAHGFLNNYWVFSEGDPTGQYTMRVTLDGVEVASANLQVQ